MVPPLFLIFSPPLGYSQSMSREAQRMDTPVALAAVRLQTLIVVSRDGAHFL